MITEFRFVWNVITHVPLASTVRLVKRVLCKAPQIDFCFQTNVLAQMDTLILAIASTVKNVIILAKLALTILKMDVHLAHPMFLLTELTIQILLEVSVPVNQVSMMIK